MLNKGRWLAIFGCIIGLLGLGLTPPILAQDAPSASGQLAIIRGDGNLYIYDVATQTFTQLTDDAGRQRAYLMPTWSSDGQLAYFGRSVDPADTYDLGIFVRPDPLNSDTLHFHGTSREVFTYASWSPADCPSGACRDLAILYSTPSGLSVRRMRSTADTFTIAELGQGAPFYWDWSPDGQQMFWARDGRTLELYDVASDEVTQLFNERQGFQRSVDWSPVDNRLLTAVLNERGRTDLVIFDGDERIPLLTNLPSYVWFSWSPDAQQVVYLESSLGQLGIIDVASQEVIALPARDVLAFAWSPTGEHIAYLTLPEASDDVSAKPSHQIPQLAWRVYDVANGTSTEVARFLPNEQMIYYFQFFDQFLHSHALWSPNGQYLVYAEITPNGEERVMLVDVTAANPRPIEVSAGSIGIFSWQ